MSPEVASKQGTDKTVIYLLGAIVVLLVVIVAAFFFKAQAGSPSIGGQVTAPTAPPGNPGIQPSTGTEFDPATATKVPPKQNPEAYVKAYYQAILAKKWDAAFKMQPAASQKGASVADFQSTQTGYGMKAFNVLSSKAQGDVATVEVEQDLGANGKWGVEWTFAKYKDGWVVQSRKVVMK